MSEEQFRVIILPEEAAITAIKGDNLLEVIAKAGLGLKSTCGGAGTCGRCLVKVLDGEPRVESQLNLSINQRKAGMALACKTFVEGDLTLSIPEESRLNNHQVLLGEGREEAETTPADGVSPYPLEPLSRKFTVELTPPSLEDWTSDYCRLLAELKQQSGITDLQVNFEVVGELADLLRQADWRVSATLVNRGSFWEVIQVEPGNSPKPSYGIAVDIGTTTVVAALVDLSTGTVQDRKGTYNRQATYGDDVISRIIHAVEEPAGLVELKAAVRDTINGLLQEILVGNKLVAKDIHAMTVAGNTTMSHLFLGISPRYIRLEPYTPTLSKIPPLTGENLGLSIHPQATVFGFPAVASYVGGDIVAGVLATQLGDGDPMTLLVDIGTNGEMVLGNNQWMVTCACSAGPAFEGGGITHGMRAMGGAIERVSVDPLSWEVELSVVGGGRPIGICGSGLIDCLGQLKQAGIIDRAGKFTERLKHSRLIDRDGEKEFILAYASQAQINKDITISENDIKNLIRSKGAVYAGVRSLLRLVELDVEAIDQVLIAGGFGNYLNIDQAIEIGLLPDLPREKYQFVGNTSLKGAIQALNACSAWEKVEQIMAGTTYLELSAGNLFLDEYVSALFLPHTDLNQFPTVAHI
ncbi:MAG: ASKHA domain-containing protein [Carboxydocellales bacterium]